MHSTAAFALFLVWSLVAVHSQSFPYISFMGETLPNYTYVDLTLVVDPVAGTGRIDFPEQPATGYDVTVLFAFTFACVQKAYSPFDLVYTAVLSS